MHATDQQRNTPAKTKPTMAAKDAEWFWRNYRDTAPDAVEDFLRGFLIVSNPRSGNWVSDGLKHGFSETFTTDVHFSEDTPDRERVASALDAACGILGTVANFNRVAFLAVTQGLDCVAKDHRELAQNNHDLALSILAWANRNSLPLVTDPLIEALRLRVAQKAAWRYDGDDLGPSAPLYRAPRP